MITNGAQTYIYSSPTSNFERHNHCQKNYSEAIETRKAETVPRFNTPRKGVSARVRKCANNKA